MIRHLTIAALLLFAMPAAARDLDPSAGNNGVTGRGAGNVGRSTGGNEPNVTGRRFSYPSCSTLCGGASGRHGSQGGVRGGTGNGNGNGNDSNGYGNRGRL